VWVKDESNRGYYRTLITQEDFKHVGLWNETIEARGPPFHSISNETKAGRISNEMLLAYATEEDIEYIPFNDGWP